jgi:hypothetical protein
MNASSLPERGTWVFPQKAFVKVSSYLVIYLWSLTTVLISKLDDEVSVILGCDFPMVLRPSGSNRYEVVGPCFVHGLMLGEALKPPLEPPWKDVLPVARGWALSYFINGQTGELKNKENEHISMNDPRMSAEAIKQRGIVLETLELI